MKRRIGLMCVTIAALFCATDPLLAAGCNDAAPQPLVHVALPGNPFTPIPTRDGCWIFVSLTTPTPGIAVIKRFGGQLTMTRVVRVAGAPTGMVLSHDGSLLIVADTSRVAFLDVQRLISGSGDAVVGYWSSGIANVGHIYVNVTKDDHYLFVSNESAQTISVLDLMKARISSFRADALIGNIPVGVAPIALTFSSDERVLFSTSQSMLGGPKWPVECRPEGNSRAPANHPQGAVFVIDVNRATTNPATAVIGTVPAGCSPVRLVTARHGSTVYVTARGDNSVYVFNAEKLVSDPSNALLGTVPVGTAPVGIAALDDGRLIATSSNRFAGDAADKQWLYLADTSGKRLGPRSVLGVIQAGAFPREIRITADNKTLLATNFGSQTLEVVDLLRAPVQPVPHVQ